MIVLTRSCWPHLTYPEESGAGRAGLASPHLAVGCVAGAGSAYAGSDLDHSRHLA
jgi:hypothetical protein